MRPPAVLPTIITVGLLLAVVSFPAGAPNALITYGETGEIGITVGRGKLMATGGIMPGEESECSGKVKVTATLISGEYVCAGVTSFDPATGLGTVDIKVRFTAKS